MNISKNINDIRSLVKAAKQEGRRVALVPTMGALHKGHLSLVEEAKQHSDFVVMTIFLNRIQFNDPKDFDSYPLTLKEDIAKAEAAGVDLLFTPDEATMYDRQLSFVDVETLTSGLCGATRPGHFRGVFTVVSKFFNIVQPDLAIFGQKDIQQALSIQKMVSDLNFPIDILIAPIVREDDGLALSSRNVKLTTLERRQALSLYKSLRLAEDMIKSGMRNSATIIESMRTFIEEQGGATAIDYITIADAKRLQELEVIESDSVVALAVFFGTTRLIDNMIIKVKGNSVECVF